ncbi:hypothetical protein M011DRAFT_222647 [Sporormia fimetaria CBS 119925]|uniref:Uncharacterized protein n=1 Tax=Sporormia fimetaria CBS 119925 TaxID=1340428 RepID=A0A6A6V233_9PLEO|nr:hypothetical protein M011DRAFT_222647 [Sporormia fimetaria CBS 119925]
MTGPGKRGETKYDNAHDRVEAKRGGDNRKQVRSAPDHPRRCKPHSSRKDRASPGATTAGVLLLRVSRSQVPGALAAVRPGRETSVLSLAKVSEHTYKVCASSNWDSCGLRIAVTVAQQRVETVLGSLHRLCRLWGWCIKCEVHEVHNQWAGTELKEGE